MTPVIQHPDEPLSNQVRATIARSEPVGLRTRTPTLAVLARSAGLYHWTPEGRKLADFTSGVLVTNLGHHPAGWLESFMKYLEWTPVPQANAEGFVALPPWTAYNAITPIEQQAVSRLLASLRRTPGGARLERVLWSASGSEGIQKALWACLRHRPQRSIILATRHGFHGKKGLAGAVTGDEHSPERDPRVKFLSFPKRECYDICKISEPFDFTPYARELEQLAAAHRGQLNCLITEPYLGGGGSFHPPKAYLQGLERFCRDHDLLFILDEVQSNFGRTGSMYAFETYGIEPDIVVLGKGMGNGVPVNAAVGRADVFGSLDYGEGSDTWSAHPLGCAAVLATLDVFEQTPILEKAKATSSVVERGLVRLKELPHVAAIRGEGMVWGVELKDYAGVSSGDVAMHCVRRAYLGDEHGNAIHLLGPLAGNVIRISPPLTMSVDEAEFWLNVLYRVFERAADELAG